MRGILLDSDVEDTPGKEAPATRCHGPEQTHQRAREASENLGDAKITAIGCPPVAAPPRRQSRLRLCSKNAVPNPAFGSSASGTQEGPRQPQDDLTALATPPRQRLNQSTTTCQAADMGEPAAGDGITAATANEITQSGVTAPGLDLIKGGPAPLAAAPGAKAKTGQGNATAPPLALRESRANAPSSAPDATARYNTGEQGPRKSVQATLHFFAPQVRRISSAKPPPPAAPPTEAAVQPAPPAAAPPSLEASLYPGPVPPPASTPPLPDNKLQEHPGDGRIREEAVEPDQAPAVDPVPEPVVGAPTPLLPCQVDLTTTPCKDDPHDDVILVEERVGGVQESSAAAAAGAAAAEVGGQVGKDAAVEMKQQNGKAPGKPPLTRPRRQALLPGVKPPPPLATQAQAPAGEPVPGGLESGTNEARGGAGQSPLKKRPRRSSTGAEGADKPVGRGRGRGGRGRGQSGRTSNAGGEAALAVDGGGGLSLEGDDAAAAAAAGAGGAGLSSAGTQQPSSDTTTGDDVSECADDSDAEDYAPGSRRRSGQGRSAAAGAGAKRGGKGGRSGRGGRGGARGGRGGRAGRGAASDAEQQQQVAEGGEGELAAGMGLRTRRGSQVRTPLTQDGGAVANAHCASGGTRGLANEPSVGPLCTEEGPDMEAMLVEAQDDGVVIVEAVEGGTTPGATAGLAAGVGAQEASGQEPGGGGGGGPPVAGPVNEMFLSIKERKRRQKQRQQEEAEARERAAEVQRLTLEQVRQQEREQEARNKEERQRAREQQRQRELEQQRAEAGGLESIDLSASPKQPPVPVPVNPFFRARKQRLDAAAGGEAGGGPKNLFPSNTATTGNGTHSWPPALAPIHVRQISGENEDPGSSKHTERAAAAAAAFAANDGHQSIPSSVLLPLLDTPRADTGAGLQLPVPCDQQPALRFFFLLRPPTCALPRRHPYNAARSDSSLQYRDCQSDHTHTCPEPLAADGHAIGADIKALGATSCIGGGGVGGVRSITEADDVPMLLQELASYLVAEQRRTATAESGGDIEAELLDLTSREDILRQLSDEYHTRRRRMAQQAPAVTRGAPGAVSGGGGGSGGSNEVPGPPVSAHRTVPPGLPVAEPTVGPAGVSAAPPLTSTGEVAQLWCVAQQPTSASELCGNVAQVGRLREWLGQWREIIQQEGGQRAEEGTTAAAAAAPPAGTARRGGGRGRGRRRGAFSDSSDFYTEDGDSDWDARSSGGTADSGCGGGGGGGGGGAEHKGLPTALVLRGPGGCGKSAAAYAVAAELGFRVLEVNPSVDRTGPQLLRMVGEATKSRRLVHGLAAGGGGQLGKAEAAPSGGGGLGSAVEVTTAAEGGERGDREAGARGRRGGGGGTTRRKTCRRARAIGDSSESPCSSPSPSHVKRRKTTGRSSGAGTTATNNKGAVATTAAQAAAARLFGAKAPTHPAAPTAPAPTAPTGAVAPGVGSETALAGAAGGAPGGPGSVTLMLFDEVDVLPEEDRGFLAALVTIVQESKRPIILTAGRGPLPPVLRSLGLQELIFQPPLESQLLREVALACAAAGVNASHVQPSRASRQQQQADRPVAQSDVLWGEGQQQHKKAAAATAAAAAVAGSGDEGGVVSPVEVLDLSAAADSNGEAEVEEGGSAPAAGYSALRPAAHQPPLYSPLLPTLQRLVRKYPGDLRRALIEAQFWLGGGGGSSGIGRGDYGVSEGSSRSDGFTVAAAPLFDSGCDDGDQDADGYLADREEESAACERALRQAEKAVEGTTAAVAAGAVGAAAAAVVARPSNPEGLEVLTQQVPGNVSPTVSVESIPDTLAALLPHLTLWWPNEAAATVWRRDAVSGPQGALLTENEAVAPQPTTASTAALEPNGATQALNPIVRRQQWQTHEAEYAANRVQQLAIRWMELEAARHAARRASRRPRLSGVRAAVAEEGPAGDTVTQEEEQSATEVEEPQQEEGEDGGEDAGCELRSGSEGPAMSGLIKQQEGEVEGLKGNNETGNNVSCDAGGLGGSCSEERATSTQGHADGNGTPIGLGRGVLELGAVRQMQSHNKRRAEEGPGRAGDTALAGGGGGDVGGGGGVCVSAKRSRLSPPGAPASRETTPTVDLSQPPPQPPHPQQMQPPSALGDQGPEAVRIPESEGMAGMTHTDEAPCDPMDLSKDTPAAGAQSGCTTASEQQQQVEGKDQRIDNVAPGEGDALLPASGSGLMPPDVSPEGSTLCPSEGDARVDGRELSAPPTAHEGCASPLRPPPLTFNAAALSAPASLLAGNSTMGSSIDSAVRDCRTQATLAELYSSLSDLDLLSLPRDVCTTATGPCPVQHQAASACVRHMGLGVNPALALPSDRNLHGSAATWVLADAVRGQEDLPGRLLYRIATETASSDTSNSEPAGPVGRWRAAEAATSLFRLTHSISDSIGAADLFPSEQHFHASQGHAMALQPQQHAPAACQGQSMGRSSPAPCLLASLHCVLLDVAPAAASAGREAALDRVAALAAICRSEAERQVREARRGARMRRAPAFSHHMGASAPDPEQQEVLRVVTKFGGGNTLAGQSV